MAKYREAKRVIVEFAGRAHEKDYTADSGGDLADKLRTLVLAGAVARPVNDNAKYDYEHTVTMAQGQPEDRAGRIEMAKAKLAAANELAKGLIQIARLAKDVAKEQGLEISDPASRISRTETGPRPR